MFFLALLVRIIYSIAAPVIFYDSADTMGYYTLGMNMFAHPAPNTIITPYRTPVYPLFLNAVMYLTGAGGAPLGSPAFLRGMQGVVAVQMIIGAIAFTAFYQALTRLLPKCMTFLFIIFLLCDVFIIGWERTLLTEGLAISVSLFITAVLLHIFLSPSGKKFVLLGFLFAFGFLLRPSFVVLPMATLAITAWYFRKQKRVVFWACITLAVSTAIPLTYARINHTNYTYFGIQYVGDIDVLGRILEFQIPIESAKNYPYFYSTVSDSRTRSNIIPTGFQFLSTYDPAIWDKTYRFVELQAFNRTVLLNNLPLYITKTAATIPEILLEVCDFILVPRTNILWALQKVYGYAQYATLAVPLLWIPMGILFLVKPTQWNAVVALTGTIAMSQIVLTALVVYKDIGGQYGRVLSVIQPQMYLFLFLCAVTCLRMYRKHQI